MAALRSDREVLPLGDVVPSGVSPGDLERYQRELFLDSSRPLRLRPPPPPAARPR